MNKIITSFAPISNSSARVLILGSMPGVKSLNAGQYYAHKQNAFWKILAELTGLNPAAPYAERLEQLVGSGIALWDVLHSCEREGSLDAAIDFSTVQPNDFVTFFREHPYIQLVCFNGAVAERCYNTHVLPTVRDIPISYARLPSTSPAHAALSFQDKVAAWRAILGA
jgi:hypoxanthine-DNA glycosylase